MQQCNKTMQKLIKFDEAPKENIKKKKIQTGHKILIIHTKY